LGINRNDVLTKKKVIEVLRVENDGLRFGGDIFDIPNSLGLMRKVYIYSIEADMALLFENDGLIVMDHLSPVQGIYEGKFMYYRPDFSFDALELKKGRWSYKSDYDARLRKNLKDRFYEMELPDQQKVY
jgi:hypothetical protein